MDSPNEIWVMILSHCDAATMASAARVSRHFRALTESAPVVRGAFGLVPRSDGEGWTVLGAGRGEPAEGSVRLRRPTKGLGAELIIDVSSQCRAVFRNTQWKWYEFPNFQQRSDDWMVVYLFGAEEVSRGRLILPMLRLRRFFPKGRFNAAQARALYDACSRWEPDHDECPATREWSPYFSDLTPVYYPSTSGINYISTYPSALTTTTNFSRLGNPTVTIDISTPALTYFVVHQDGHTYIRNSPLPESEG